MTHPDVVRTRAKMLALRMAQEQGLHPNVMADAWEGSVAQIMKTQIEHFGFPVDAQLADFLSGWRSAGNPINHGTRDAYNRSRCRCLECKAANAAWMRKRRARDKTVEDLIMQLEVLPTDYDAELLERDSANQEMSLFMKKIIARRGGT